MSGFFKPHLNGRRRQRSRGAEWSGVNLCLTLMHCEHLLVLVSSVLFIFVRSQPKGCHFFCTGNVVVEDTQLVLEE